MSLHIATHAAPRCAAIRRDTAASIRINPMCSLVEASTHKLLYYETMKERLVMIETIDGDVIAAPESDVAPVDARAISPQRRATIEAMREAERISSDPNAKSYASFAELLADIDD